MPVSLRKDGRFWLSLASDETVPEASRPAFQFRPFTGRDHVAHQELTEPAAAEGRGGRSVLFDVLALTMTGWRNLRNENAEGCPEIEFAPEGIADRLNAILTLDEASELLEKRRERESLTGAEKKASGSPSGPASAGSAGSTVPAAATEKSAATPPA